MNYTFTLKSRRRAQHLLFLFLTPLLLASCSTRLVTISVNEPAPVSLSGDLKKVGVVNRTVPSDDHEKINKLDQVLSGEGKNLDKDGAEATIQGAKDELLRNERFESITVLAEEDLRSPTVNTFPSPLNWTEVERVCQDNGVDVLFTLELFDTETKLDYTTRPTTLKTPLGNVKAIEHEARMTTIIYSGWRIYDPQSKTLRDEWRVVEDITFTGRGINPVVAAGGLLNRKDAVLQVSTQAGQVYAQRILPYTVRVSRDYYVKGTDDFKVARRRAEAGNWDGAGDLWYQETKNPKAKVAGRACYNVAIINEINGELEVALEWAQKAYGDYGDKRGLTYVRILEDRIARRAKLQMQLDQIEGSGE